MCSASYSSDQVSVLKAQLKLKGITYSQLVEKLEAAGVKKKETHARKKLSRGSFTATFMLRCLTAIGGL
ncbi:MULTISPECIES: DUF6471 domain-containing protein [Hyphomonas]|uniref:DUF6471 domain-containing protein n=1 Tax=Hyphomonas TaxID=85 RepID=UPI003516E2DE